MSTTKPERSGGSGGMRSLDDSPTPNVFPPPESLRPTLVGSRYAVSAGHPVVAQIAAQVLERGGTAIDAGVAAGLASNVVQVDMANFGGIAPIVLRTAASDQVWSIAGVGTWGRDATVDAFRERFGDDMPLGGAVSIVPGAPAGWIAALRELGTWSFADVAAPAIELAAGGFPLDHRTAKALEIFGDGFSGWESTRNIYWPKGRPPKPGEWLYQPQLAALLQQLADAETGADRNTALTNVHNAFYEGEVAQRIVDFVRADGGWLTLEDLAEFEADVAPAPSCDYHGYRVHTTSTWSQGPVILQSLAILAGYDLVSFGHNSANYIHCVAEAMKLAFSDRERYYGDPRFVDVNLDWLTSSEHTKELCSLIDANASLPSLPTLPVAQRKRHDTTSFCIMDGAGNAFSATPSDTIDGSPVVPELGIIVSPRGVQSRLDPDHPTALAPGKRPRVTPAPALALSTDAGNDRRIIAFGCPGGDVIVQAMLQVFLNYLHFGMTAQQAVEAPRIATFSFPDSFYPNTQVPTRLSLESRVDEDVWKELEARSHNLYIWPDYEFDAGGVTLVADMQTPDSDERVLEAGADPRRSSYAVGR